MAPNPVRPPRLLALSDLHVGYRENRAIVENLRSESGDDWLIVAGDVGELFADIEWALGLLRDRFAQVIWVPGNHELWTHGRETVPWRGEERYRHLVELGQRLGVITPEDPYPVWTGPGGPVTIAPMFLLYDYSWLPENAPTREEALDYAYQTGVVCSDERVLYPDPYQSREAWCWARVEATERRLAGLDPAVGAVLVNHWPLVREPTRILRYPQFAQWCGTDRTASWPTRFNAVAVVYGHIHIPRTTWYDGVRFEEVSVGYPREWRRRTQHPGIPDQPGIPRQILPVPDTPQPSPDGVFR
jgi:3',5'-cyclic AMP phosphodiesterase CpdA